MFENHQGMPDLNKIFAGYSPYNHAPPSFSFGIALDDAYDFLDRVAEYCTEEANILSIIDNGIEVGLVKVGKYDDIQVINSFYLWPSYRGKGHFIKYMGELCQGDIQFCLRPFPHNLFTDQGEEINDIREFYYATKSVDDHSNIQRITDRYLSLGLQHASITGLTKDFLTNYRPNDHPRIIIKQ